MFNLSFDIVAYELEIRRKLKSRPGSQTYRLAC